MDQQSCRIVETISAVTLGKGCRIDQNGTSQDDGLAEADQEPAELYDLANSILTECKEAAQPTELAQLASSALDEFHQATPLSSLETAISLHRDALRLREGPHVERSVSINGLALALTARFYRTGHILDLDEAISLLREALVLVPDSDRNRVEVRNNLSAALLTRFGKSSDLLDFHDAVLLRNESPNPGHNGNTTAMGPAMNNRIPEFHGPQMPTMDMGIFMKDLEALMLGHTANDHYRRFQLTGQLSDLNTAVSLHREVLDRLSTGCLDRPNVMSNFAVLLYERFKQVSQLTDLQEAIELHREVIGLRPAPHPYRSQSLNNLAVALDARFRQTGQSEDADEAISLHLKALELRPASHPDHTKSLNNLAAIIAARFDQTGCLEDLDGAISLLRKALALIPAQHPNRASLLNNLASAHGTRFSLTGRMEELDEAISLHSEVLKLRPLPHPDHSMSLNNLALILPSRFILTRRIEDLNEAILLHRQALGLLHASHIDRPSSLNNLALVLDSRFVQTGQVQDADEAISLYRELLGLFPASHPKRPLSLHNLASILSKRLSSADQVDDINQAISHHREALGLLPEPDPLRSMSLSSLATALSTRFNLSRQIEDVDEAISLHQAALHLRPAPHPERSVSLINLAGCFMEKYYNMPVEEQSDLDDALLALRSAVEYEYAPAIQRFHIAKGWILVADANHAQCALEAYQAAITLLPRIVTLDLDLLSRQEALIRGIDGLARNTAACAIRSSQFEKAVTFLEEGRSIFWSQALQLRTPSARLESSSPSLAKQFKDLSRVLDLGSQREVSWSLTSPSVQRLTTEQEAVRYRTVHRNWLNVLEQIRKLDGLHNFLLPTPFKDLQKAAALGTVVILNASDSGCSALAMTSSSISHVPLPRCTLENVGLLAKMIQIACGARFGSVAKSQLTTLTNTMRDLPHPYAEDRHGGPARTINADSDEIFQEVLGALWTSVVEPIFRSLGLKKTDSPCRMWWCPTGPFSFLPIHAAGLYHTAGATSVLDYVVPSYTPSLKALLVDQPPITDNFKMMAVIQPDIPNGSPLPFTEEELCNIEKHVPNHFLVRLGIKGNPATVQNVLSHLSSSHIVHFACHGKQHAGDPLESGLILHGGNRLKISEIMKQPTPNASLAFLSACETAMGEENLPDEAMHLAASLLFAGFRGVVATMWTIYDEDGPKIADSFYQYLFLEVSSSTGIQTYPDKANAARALHYAVSKLRADQQCSFRRWVPFVHVGL